MTTAMSLCLLFLAKMADNALSTVKTIMIQRNRSLLAGVAIALSSFLYFWITRSVVLADSLLTTLTVAVASGVGCFLVSGINNKLSKDRTYVNVVMSDDMAAIMNISTRRLLTSITREIGGFFVSKKIFSRIF